MLKKILSYLVPVNVTSQKSDWSKDLEVTWNNGQLVLDSKNTNYSYGSLQRILRTGLKEIGYDKIARMGHVLVLGVAGGSVIKVLANETGFKGKITGVEIDPAVIELAKSYFRLGEVPNLEIHIADASVFVKRTSDKYDLIIIDIFQDTTMPDFLFEEEFIQNTASLLKQDGRVLFNTMILNSEDSRRNRHFKETLDKLDFQYKVLPRLEVHNELILFEKNNR